jgi:2-iminobutanoate/2-iminopropanoate deaminase
MEIIFSPHAPAPIGPYVQAVKSLGLLFISGQIPLDPVTGLIKGEDIATQTSQVLANLRAILAEAGLDPTHVVRTTIFLTDLADFPVVNQIYGDFFHPHQPARSTVQVAALPKAARIEIEAIAVC